MLINVQEVLDEVSSIIDNSIWRNRYSLALKNLKEELNAPCVLAIAGKVKAGKSFLVNALLGVDIAMTGTTETTATVNIFKKGVPLSKDKPILCVYLDGRKEWVSKDYLDSLQGTSETALAKTAQIDKLIMYIDDNPLLEHVTLVDTPGIGAEVGEDGDSHQVHTDSYFKLRERHQNETINLSNTADAVIYIFNTVPTETDKSFLTSLYNGGNGLTSLNGIGVLSKIDKDISQIDNVPRFCNEFDHNLYTIVPTSAALEKYLPSVYDAQQLKEKLNRGFTQEKGFLLALGSETAFLHEKLPFCTISVNERKAMLDSFAKSDLAWSSFALIAKELYYSNDIQSSLLKLKKVSGFEDLRQIIFNHFFNRSHLLRCNKIIEEMRHIINEIIYDESFAFAEDNSRLKDVALRSCQSLPLQVREFVLDLINKNVPSLEQVLIEKSKIENIRIKIDEIKNKLRKVNDSFMTYQKVTNNKEQFTNDEFDELCSLFAGKVINIDYRNRYKYWSSVYNVSTPNSIRQLAAKNAKNIYMEYLSL